MLDVESKTQTRVVTLAALLVLGACATPKVDHAGFLQSYEQLQVSDETGAVHVHTSSVETLALYSKIHIEEATMLEQRLSEPQSMAIRDALMSALHEQLSRDREVVAGGETANADATLLVRYAIVEVETSNVALNALTSVVIGAVDYGSLALEAEVVDAKTGALVASMTWARGAKPTNVLGAYTSTGNARALAPDFAKRLARLISPTEPA